MNVLPAVSSRGRRRHRSPVLATMVAVLSLVLAACAGSSSTSAGAPSASPAGSSGSSSASGSGVSATGSPIRVMTMTSLNSQGPVYPNIAETAQVYAKWINARGGINGHPLQVDICDDQGQPTQASSCARQAVSNNDVAVVGSYTFFADNVVPILANAHIAWFGECCPGTTSELSSPDSFPLGSGLMYAVGMVKEAVAMGYKKISVALVHGAEPYLPPMENAIKALGLKFVGSPVIIPQTAQDDSALVAKATTGSDAVLMVLNETLFKPWLTAWKQAGATQRMFGPQGNLDAVSIQGFQDITNGDVIAGVYPDLSLPPWKDYRAALKEYNAPTNLDYNSLGGMGTWAAYTAFDQIASKISGPITAQAFLTAANQTTDLNLNGMVPPINFTQPWTNGLPGFSRLFNRSVIFQQVKNGKIVPLTTSFEDVSNLALGKAG